MKKYLLLLAAAAFTFAACTEDEGTTPGGDSQPSVTVYTYSAAAPYDADVDCRMRVCTNNQTAEVYYLTENTDDYEAAIEQMIQSNHGQAYLDDLKTAVEKEYATNIKKIADNLYAEAETTPEAADEELKKTVQEAINEYVEAHAASKREDYVKEALEKNYSAEVLKHGKKLGLAQGQLDTDTILQNLVGQWTITVVGTKGNQKSVGQASFTGAAWKTITEGVYYTDMAGLKELELPCTLQVSEDNPKLYRLKNAWGTGKHIGLKRYGAFADGTLAMTMDRTATNLSYGSYGTIFMTDYATYQNNTGYVGYNTLDPNTGYMSVLVMYYVSAGNLGYTFDTFLPDGMEMPAEGRARRSQSPILRSNIWGVAVH